MRLIGIALIFTLAGCSSGGSSAPLVKGIWERIKAGRGAEESSGGGKQVPSREQIEKFDLALVQMNLAGEDTWPILFARSINGPYATYAGGKFPQSITLRESQVTATRGLGTDLISASSSENDPLKRLTQPDNWPTQVSREYRFAGPGAQGRLEQFDCTLQRAGEAEITLAGTPFAVVGFAENCSRKAGAFQNLYAADAKPGRVWPSVQYIGSAMPIFTSAFCSFR